MTLHVIPYKPRPAFLPFHNRTKRWSCLVAHRRAGKTVAAINDLIRAAVTSKSPMPQFAYIAPFRSQAKSVAWDYLKHFSATAAASTNESELTVDMINGSKVRLFGADNADAMRGLGFDGIFMDEYGDFKPSVWGNVIRPSLSDRQGWAVFGGTPKGKNQFWDIKQTAARLRDEWFLLELPASKSGLLPEGELAAARAQLSKDQYDQEYEISFEASILGAFFGTEMREAAEQGRICRVDYQPEVPVHTAWDLGYRDDTAIWFYQVIRGEIHVIDYHAVSGANIAEICATVTSKPYNYGKHYLPHDARAKTLAAQGKSIIEQMAEYLGINNLAIVPDLSVQDGIQAVRQMLPNTWFDAEKCDEGMEALRQYQREYDEDKKAFRQTPRHDWCFTGDTMILTRYGMCQIMNLPYSGEVLTSCGWKRYINPRVTRKNASLVEVRFASGYSVKCTPDHSFKTESGWICAESLLMGMPIQSALTPLRSISMVVCTVYGRVTNTYHAAARSCTEMLGGLHSALSQMVATFTTGTAIQRIIVLPILNVSPQKSIFQKLGINNQNGHSRNQLEMPQQHGINRQKGACGISGTQNGNSYGQKQPEQNNHVCIAAYRLWHWFVSKQLVKSIAPLTAKWLRIVREVLTKPQQLVIENVKKLNNRADVWCLTVPDAEEFALANGAIVHNCSHPADAMRMLAIVWRQEPTVKQPDKVKPLIVGPGNEVTLDDMWATHQQFNKRKRL